MSLRSHKEIAGGHEYTNLYELIPGRFYFVTFEKKTPCDSEGVHYFTTDDTTEPFNLATISRFLKETKKKLSHPDLESKAVVYSTSGSERERYKAAISVAVYAVVYLKMTHKEISRRLVEHTSVSSLEYLKGIEKGIELGFLDFEDFNEDYFDTLDKIKLNWIVPGKLMKFSGPLLAEEKNFIPPKHYLNYFRDNGVSTVVRVNHMRRDASPFVDTELDHYDLIIDDTLPTETNVRCFLEICETSEGAVVVQRREGFELGRTSCLFGAYLMDRYRLKASEALTWLQVCSTDCTSPVPARRLDKEARSEPLGAEVKPLWSKKAESFLTKLGKKLHVKHAEKEIPPHKYGICSFSGLGIVGDDSKQDVAQTPSVAGQSGVLAEQSIIQEEKGELL